jgi:hypothetical protein
MWNLLLGAVCGAVLAATATVAAVRSPAVQERLGIVRVDAAPLASRGTDPAACPQAAPAAVPGEVGRSEMLFTRQRLWSVPP